MSAFHWSKDRADKWVDGGLSSASPGTWRGPAGALRIRALCQAWASDRLVRDQLDQQQLARAEQLSIISSAEEELADEKRTQRSMRCGVVLSVLEDVRAQWRQLISLEPQDISSLLITTSMIFAESLPFRSCLEGLAEQDP